jgi:branched-chain amino acid aminotransferase
MSSTADHEPTGERMLESGRIWMNGELVEWGDAKVHVLTHALHYGSAVFEGIRAYETEHGTAVFRLGEHLKRLERSAEVYFMKLPFALEELRQATHATIAANELATCYVRPLVFRGYGEMGVNPLNCPVEVMIAVWPWGAYLGEEALQHGVRVKTSSFRRIGPNTIPATAKATGQYLNSQLAKMEAAKSGYDEAILLNEQGFLADGSGENVFVVRDGVLSTPPVTASCLPGITRDTVIRIAAELGLPVLEHDVVRTDLYHADEVFFTGTAAEVTPIRSIDDHEIGAGPITKRIQAAFFEVTAGRSPLSADYLDYPQPAPKPQPARA